MVALRSSLTSVRLHSVRIKSKWQCPPLIGKTALRPEERQHNAAHPHYPNNASIQLPPPAEATPHTFLHTSSAYQRRRHFTTPPHHPVYNYSAAPRPCVEPIGYTVMNKPLDRGAEGYTTLIG